MPRTSESELVLWPVGKHSSEITMATFPPSAPVYYESEDQREIARLKRELRDAQDALDVLKKAISILEKD